MSQFDVDPPDLIPYPGLSKRLRDMAKQKAKLHFGFPRKHGIIIGLLWDIIIYELLALESIFRLVRNFDI